MNSIVVNRPLTDNLVNTLNDKSISNNILIELDNTKGLDTKLINRLDSRIVISVKGGLSSRKKKYNNVYYQSRTKYTPKELVCIIDKLERIEKNILPTWDDLHKALYVYKTLCESSIYSVSTCNGKEAEFNLLGLITGRSTSFGFAIIFKEAMDRLGINCYYQNIEDKHSWNIIEIDGKYYGVELAWDVYNKKNNKCGFMFFCREDKNKFYSNKYHNISKEQDEIDYPLSKISIKDIISALEDINDKKLVKEKVIEHNHEKISNVYGYDIIIKNNLPYLRHNDICTFIRNDSTSFLLWPTGVFTKGVYEYIYLEYVVEIGYIRATKIYSEMNLLSTDISIRNNIANNLLSIKRISTKINSFNGYLGYIKTK